MAPVSVTAMRSFVRIYHKDEQGVLHSLEDFDLSKRILDAISLGKHSISTRLFTDGDLKRLTQIGLGRATEVNVVVEFPWDGKTFSAIVAKANKTKLRRQVLVMALDRIRRTPSLTKVLAGKWLTPSAVRENPYLGPGHAPYENFIASLMDITGANNPDGEKLFELFLKSADDEADQTTFTSVEERGVRMVFHGTNHAAMDAILKCGLDPRCRQQGLQEDYFGLDYNTSLQYTKRKTGRCYRYKLLVFIIIVNASDVPLETKGQVTVSSNRLQLPLAEITL